jgi:hypothetical protein
MSEQMQSGQSRRGLLGRGLVVLAGVVGIGAGAGAAKLATQEDDTAAASQLKLHGRNWILQTPDRRPGERLVAGERGTVYGDLVDAGGKHVGQFYGSRMAAQSSPGGPIGADSSLELHTFKLEGGTLLGIGSMIAGDSIFAIAGGTGRYAGSRGTYVAEQRLLELGGDGTAEFTIDLRT